MLPIVHHRKFWQPKAVRDPVAAGGGSPPNLSSQDALALFDTIARGRVTTDGTNGTLYWVGTTSGTAPSAAQVKAGQDNGGSAATASGNVAVSGTGQKTVRITGLTANVTYTVHFMHEDAGTVQSTVVSSSAITTYKASVSADNEDLTTGTTWILFQTSVTGNAAAGPDGTTVADNLVETAVSNSHNITHSLINFVNTSVYEAVIYFKKGSGITAPDIVQISFGTAAFGAGVYRNFNLNTVAVGAGSGTTSSSITGIGGGWFCCKTRATATVTTTTAGGSPGFTNNNDGLGKLPTYLGIITTDVLVGGGMVYVP